MATGGVKGQKAFYFEETGSVHNALRRPFLRGFWVCMGLDWALYYEMNILIICNFMQ